MKLREFVSETLKEIIAGVKEAQKYAESERAWVSPRLQTSGGKTSVRYVVYGTACPIEQIEFDVAVTSTEGAATEAGVGVFVAAIGLGAKGKSDASNSSVSRIRFSVPLGLPIQYTTKEQAQQG